MSDDEDSCILKPIVTFTISQNTLLADAVWSRGTLPHWDTVAFPEHSGARIAQLH